jgi:hypothetical protein
VAQIKGPRGEPFRSSAVLEWEGNALNPQNGPFCTALPSKYRPIALLDTLYKPWACLQAKLMSEFAEEHSFLRSQQAGLRCFHNTTHQLQLFTSALEDARSTVQNVYALLLDFTCAFNMIDHPTLYYKP